MNPALFLDGYKLDHRSQYPKGTNLVFSNMTARASRISDVKKTVFFGLQYFLKKYLIEEWNHGFFTRPKDEILTEYKRIVDNYLGPNAITFDHIADLHTLGYLPLEVKALPEGSLVDLRVPTLVLYNTHPDFFWITNYLETILSCVTWMASTSATTAHEYKKILTVYAKETSSIPEFVQWQAHDFSERGMSALEPACISGAAHLLSFTGSDTVPAIQWLEQYYKADCTKELIAGSVSATEHATMCAGTKENELDTYRRLINEIYPKGILSIVSDTWNYWDVLTGHLRQLKSDIMKRDGKLVIRPDSGTPELVICGNPEATIGSPEYKGSIELLWEVFGGKINEKGYKELDPHIGLIYGDSITLERCKKICEGLKAKGFASTNVVLGIGSYTYTYVTRDTFGFAIKATYCEVNGKPRNIYKSPVGDSIKKSAKGLLAVYQKTDQVKDGFFLEEEASWYNVENCELKTVFKNGKLTNEQTLSQIRQRLIECSPN